MIDPYRTPGRVDPPTGWKPCARKCGGWLSPWHNARRVDGVGVVCIPCYLSPAHQDSARPMSGEPST